MNLLLRNARYNARKMVEIYDEIGAENLVKGDGLMALEFYHNLAEAEDDELEVFPGNEFRTIIRIWFTVVPLAWTMRFVGGLFNLVDKIKGR